MPQQDPWARSAQDIEQAKQFLRKRGNLILPVSLLLLLIIGAYTAVYQVPTGNLGVVLRFGRHVGNSQPGLHMKWPFGLERVIMVPVKRQLKMEFGFRTTKAGVQSEFRRDYQTTAEATMLTGDLNVGMVEWIVQYRISDPARFLFAFRDIYSTFRLMSEAVMRSVVGDHSIDELITSGREEVESQAKVLLTQLNSHYDTGITVVQLKLQDANAPAAVKPAFREVEEAKQERERLKNEARRDYNQVIPKAKGLALEQIERAQGYAIARVNRATGDSKRFIALQKAYSKAPSVTQTRLYLETLDEILPKVKRKIIIDSRTQGIFPFLQIGQGEK